MKCFKHKFIDYPEGKWCTQCEIEKSWICECGRFHKYSTESCFHYSFDWKFLYPIRKFINKKLHKEARIFSV